MRKGRAHVGGGLDLTGLKMKPHDTTGISLFTEDGVTERNLINQRGTDRGDESTRNIFGRGIDFEKNYRSPINEVDEEHKNHMSKSYK